MAVVESRPRIGTWRIVQWVLIALAVILFLLATFSVKQIGNADLQNLGLALFAASFAVAWL